MSSRKEEIRDWAEALSDMLSFCPDPAATLAEVDRIGAERAAEAAASWVPTPVKLKTTFRNQRGVMRVKSQVILAFARVIRNYHSPAEADQILFMKHRGPGSGYLADYISDLPSLRAAR